MRLFYILFLIISSLAVNGQVGTSVTNPYIIYPATSCTNSCGAQYCGNMQCPTGDCGAYVTAAGSSGGLNPICTTDDEVTQKVIWLDVYATTTSFTINNGSPYVGGGSANANRRDYTVYSGSVGALTQIACGSVAANSAATITGLTTGAWYKVMISPSSTNTTANATNICITAPVGYAAPGNTCAAAVSLTTNVTYTYTNAGSTADASICSGSVENNTWYSWCAPANWPAGQQAYISVFNQICNTNQGLQLSVFNTRGSCPTAATDPTVICQNPGTLTQYYYQWTAVANTCYLITLDGFAGTACQYRLTVGSIVVLPIELAKFDARNEGSKVKLEWATATEVNNDFFTIERSKDGKLFEPLQLVDGAGNSSMTINYSVYDEKPLSGISYYRIKQTDFDGAFSYSEMIAVRRNSNGTGLALYPNPANQEVQIAFDAQRGEQRSLRLVNALGQVVLSHEISGEEVAHQFNLENLPDGVYSLFVETAEGTVAERLVKQR
ncbi:MAG: hypothetical protein RIQ47_650 [Bacteroidota bacterium]